jgi:NAD(P)H-hydrate epimerase
MKLLDQNTSAVFHVPELVLMEQAAMAFVQRLFDLKSEVGSTLVVCGSGNNGADGLAIARLLHERGTEVTALLAGEAAGHRTSSSYEVQKKICGAYGLALVEDATIPEGNYALIVDAVFGIGLSREITGDLAALINELNGMDAWRVAVDIASGVDADTGALLGTAFRADDTITFSYGKIGQYLWPGSDYSGCVHVRRMGITAASWLDGHPQLAVLDEEDLALLPSRPAHSNKGTYGRLLVIAGSVGMAGAAVLAAQSACRMGCGLVKVVTPEENRTILQTSVPEALLLTYGGGPADEELADALKWADAVVIGPGIGTGMQAQHIVEVTLQHCKVPLLADADALNIIARNTAQLHAPHAPMIVTPHLGEMARLTGESVSQIQADLVSHAVEFAKTCEVVCVLKDFRTVTAVWGGRTYLNLSGNPGMATAGSGDVLSGIIGSLLAQGLEPSLAAPLGVYIHGLAGDEAKKRCGERALLASDIIQGVKDLKL